jgi:hypothetical protein
LQDSIKGFENEGKESGMDFNSKDPYLLMGMSKTSKNDESLLEPSGVRNQNLFHIDHDDEEPPTPEED